ncbi:helix-turn-helix transcriptional regulator [Streptomyces sp. NPDC056632]|uniref:helix-turn-helix transcriptional regulator n=1 Tax=Streptomyces sp. NPDC056632 TaxID=3345884 RepID=UPI0036C467D9
MGTRRSTMGRPGPGTGLAGREAEVGRILDAIELGRSAPQALLVTGEAGSGKTSLLEVAAEHARVTGTYLLRSQGFDGESEQSFAALHQLLLPLIPRAADLPGHLREVLETSFGLAPITRPVDPMLLRVAVLTLLVEASRHRPVVVLGDDVQLFDRDSLDVLGFVLRRFAAEPVTVLLAARGLTPPDPAVAHLPVLSLGPLTVQAAARLLDAQPESPTGRARSEVLDQAAGNPLAIIELCRSVRSGSPLGQADGALPQTQRIQEMFSDQLRALPAVTQRMVLYAAASSDQEDLQTIMSAAGVGTDLSVWASAEDAGLITIAGRQVGFRHPLVRAGAYQGAPAHLRQGAHIDLAAVHQDDPARQAWHLAAACIGQGESVAATLEDTAELVEQRGGFHAAARALERSAECSPALEDRARRYAKALRAANNAGDTFWVRELYAKITALTKDRDLLGVAANGAGLALSMSGHQREAFQLLMGALEPDLPQDARTTLAVTAVIGAVAFQSGLSEVRRPLVPLLDAIETSAVSTTYSELVADEAVNALRAVILCEADPIRNAPALLSRTRRPSLLEPLTGIAELIRLQTLGAVAWWADESDLCVDTFRRAFAMLRSYGAIGTGAIALSAMGSALIDVGRWAEADELLDEAATLAAVQKLKHIEVDIEALRVTLQALRGRSTHAGILTDPAWTAVNLEENTATHARLLRAAGTAAAAAGDYDGALRHFRQLFHQDGTPLHYFLSHGSIADLAAVAQRTGHQKEVEPVVAAVREALGPHPTTRMMLLLHHASALVGDPAQAEHHFRLALVNPSGDQWPLARAQARLHYAQWLRRRRRPLEARPLLASAMEAFSRLGATALADEARAELRASGVAAPSDRPDPLSELTAQQQQIVRLAAQGLGNKEIGEKLKLSPRTIGSHLYQVYPKLGVSSRHQLRDVVGVL